MDDWTYTHPDLDVPDTQPPLLNEDEPVVEARRARARQAEAAHVAELQQTQAAGVVGNHAEADTPLPFATPPGVALAF